MHVAEEINCCRRGEEIYEIDLVQWFFQEDNVGYRI